MILLENMRKQDLEKIIYRIDTYFIENNITITKLYAMRILLSRNDVIQTTNIKKVKKLKKKNSWTKILRSKAKLIQK